MHILSVVLLLLCLTSPSLAGTPLKIGLLPIEDAVPFHIAEQEKLYQREQVAVELIPFLSALERDSALAAGVIDGAIADPVGAILFDKGQNRLKITALCLGETPAEGIFAILAAPGSGISEAPALRHVPVAISTSTIIEYITDRLLAENGLRPEEIKKVEVVKMPIRMQMLLSGAVQAAALPEPLASIAVSKGAIRVLSDSQSHDSLSQTVIVFRSPVLSEKKAEVAAFFRAYDAAVTAINAQPEQYRTLFVDKGRIPGELAASYPIPHYPRPAPYSEKLYTPVMDWLHAKQLSPRLPYTSMVACDFAILP